MEFRSRLRAWNLGALAALSAADQTLTAAASPNPVTTVGAMAVIAIATAIVALLWWMMVVRKRRN